MESMYSVCRLVLIIIHMRVLGLFLNCLVNSEKKPLFFLIKNQFYNSRGKKVSENEYMGGGGDTCNYEQIFSSNLESDCNLQYLN